MTYIEQLGYTDAHFGPNQTFMTERAAETAIAAGIVQLRALNPELELLRDFVNASVTDPMYKFPAAIEEVNFVFRWAGKGNATKMKIPFMGERGWDTQLRTAPYETRFLNAWNISQPALDTLRLGDRPPTTTTLADIDLRNTVEISVKSWESLLSGPDPKLNEQIVKGVLFNHVRWRDFNAAQSMGRDVREALSIEGLRRNRLARDAGKIKDRGFDDLLPVAALMPSRE